MSTSGKARKSMINFWQATPKEVFLSTDDEDDEVADNAAAAGLGVQAEDGGDRDGECAVDREEFGVPNGLTRSAASASSTKRLTSS